MRYAVPVVCGAQSRESAALRSADVSLSCFPLYSCQLEPVEWINRVKAFVPPPCFDLDIEERKIECRRRPFNAKRGS